MVASGSWKQLILKLDAVTCAQWFAWQLLRQKALMSSDASVLVTLELGFTAGKSTLKRVLGVIGNERLRLRLGLCVEHLTYDLAQQLLVTMHRLGGPSALERSQLPCEESGLHQAS